MIAEPSMVFLKPGELFFSEQPTVVSTLLGSCVAVTMFSFKRKQGAICHALLPVCRKDETCDGSYPEGGRYVECCIKLMIEGLQARGIKKKEIAAKVFGGSDMFRVTSGGRPSVGRQNAEKAIELLDREGIRVVSSDLGGAYGRKIFFHTHTGEVFLKHLTRVER